MKNPVRETTKIIVKEAKKVKINQKKVEEFAEKIKDSKIPSWPKKMHLWTRDENSLLTYLIILDSLNFCFWSKKEKWGIYYKNNFYEGYFGWSLALKKFFLKNPEKANFEYFSNIGFNQFLEILKGKGELELIRKRYQILKSVSKKFLEKYQGNPSCFISLANNSAAKLVFEIYKNIPFFQDEAMYDNFKVYFLKRAQILVADIWGAFEGKGIGCFKDMDFLTAFADYKLPQILNHFEILEYSSDLQNKIQKRKIIPAFSKEEIEIRAATVQAVEEIRKSLIKRGKNLFSFQIDWLLWNKSQRLKMKNPHHLTKTIFY
ncbi:MAG TPA: queuosine salvage family protein [Candidatus Pacearchaeota archaeon]|nr:queuosine salvage family protein [Candidatus Pacearchaeota archaeon]HOK94206.1 queuosine salvage family protein [Candidatus Pacearchaeota archaeon]HPO75410.1 queuosine salvage family protein [Candidatus Pacearchaeota archaeon]